MRLVRLLVSAHPCLEVVAEAVDGHDALATFAGLNAPPIPHVIVLDNQMPGMSGLEVAAEMLAMVPDQRIVLFTAAASDVLRERAAEVGVTAVVSKDEVSSLAAMVAEL